jgi:hypothetical protein
VINIRPQVKREKVSLCNICRTKARMTWDHVPPKGGIELKPVEQESVFHRLTTDQKEKVFTISQNGVKFRTICGKCNNDWLGGKYDPALNEFTLTTGKLLQAAIQLPPVINVRARPTAIIRAILGHLLAAKSDIDDVVLDNEIRSFFFDEDAPIPDSIYVFYWIYPYASIIVLRDFVMPAVRGKFEGAGFFNLLKYFPIAYLVSDIQSYEGLSELTIFRNLKSSEFANIPIPLHKVQHYAWPETVEDQHMVMVSKSIQSSVYATPRKKKD